MGTEWNSLNIEKGLLNIAIHEDKIRERYVDLLNSYSKLNENFKFWDLIGGEWLLHFTHIVYAHYSEVVEDCKEVSIDELVPVFWDYSEFTQRMVDDNFLHRTLEGNILNHILHQENANWHFSYPLANSSARIKEIKKYLQKLIWRWLTSLISSKRATFLICNPYIHGSKYKWFLVLFSWRSWVRQDDLTYSVRKKNYVNEKWRADHASEVVGGSYEDVVMALMPLYIPNIYLENFVEFYNEVESLKIKRPNVVYTANSLHGHNVFKFLAAKWRSEGTMILVHQHGGGYGVDRISSIEDYETRVADCFYTLGWAGKKNQISLSGPTIRVDYKKLKSSNKVLLCAVNFPKEVYRLHFHPMPGKVESMISNAIELISKIHTDCNLVVRPYPHDYNRNFLDQIKACGALFEIENAVGYAAKSYASSKIVIHAYLGTSWLETLAMDIPTVCLYDANVYAFRNDAMPFILELIETKVLFRNVDAAVLHLKEILNNPQEWWGSCAVQSARKSFVDRYANFDTQWKSLWKEEFQKWA